MYNFYNKQDKKKWKRVKLDLRNIYADIPETEGCLKYISLNESEGGCGGRCCEFQQPSVFSSEFAYVYNYVNDKFSKDQIIEILLKAIKIYIFGKPTNGCIFFNKSNKQCTIHSVRPFACRTYSQEPEEEFKPKYDRLKILYQNNPDAIIMEQCNLTQPIGKKLTKEELDDLFQRLKFVEEDFGIEKEFINDKEGGSYRTFVDHLLLYSYSEEFLLQLTYIREKGTQEQKEDFFNKLSEQIHVKEKEAETVD